MSNHETISSFLTNLLTKKQHLNKPEILTIGNRQAYEKLFTEEGFYLFLKKHNMQVKREQLEIYAKECFKKKDFVNPVLATVAWGYIGLDVGPCRVFNLWGDTQRFNNSNLMMLRNNLLDGNIKEAYSWLKKLDGVADVFATKILYILSVDLELEIFPVIIDRRVINSIEKISPEIALQYCRRDKAGNVSASFMKYLEYCKDINLVSKQLKLSPSNVELILFNWNGIP